jgi:hypothetical protein
MTIADEVEFMVMQRQHIGLGPWWVAALLWLGAVAVFAGALVVGYSVWWTALPAAAFTVAVAYAFAASFVPRR